MTSLLTGKRLRIHLTSMYYIMKETRIHKDSVAAGSSGGLTAPNTRHLQETYYVAVLGSVSLIRERQ